MVRFGRVEGMLQRTAEGDLWLTVTLETRDQLAVIRDEAITPLTPPESDEALLWVADQYTQETIGAQLGDEGWEPIGGSDPPTEGEDGVFRSARYAVRNLGA